MKKSEEALQVGSRVKVEELMKKRKLNLKMMMLRTLATAVAL